MSETGRFLSHTRKESLLSKSFSIHSARNASTMRNSPSLAEMAKSYRENTSEIRSPIIADLQTEYVKALNLIDTLKAEKRERKSNHRTDNRRRSSILREERSNSREESFSRELSLVYKQEASQAAIDLERRIKELRRDKRNLMDQLEAEKNKNHAMRKQQEANLEKLDKFEEINVSNGQLRQEMSGLTSQLSDLSITLNRLEEENKRMTQLGNNCEVEDFVRHLDYILSVLEDLPETHCARIFFDERFKSGPEVTSYLNQRNYLSLLVKSIQYAADLLVNMTRSGARPQQIRGATISKNDREREVPLQQKLSSSFVEAKRVHVSNLGSEDLGNSTSNQEFVETGIDFAEDQSHSLGDSAHTSKFSTILETPKNMQRLPKEFSGSSNASKNLKHLIQQKINIGGQSSQQIQPKHFVVKQKTRQAPEMYTNQPHHEEEPLLVINPNSGNVIRVQNGAALAQAHKNNNHSIRYAEPREYSRINQSNSQNYEDNSASFRNNTQKKINDSELTTSRDHENFQYDQNQHVDSNLMQERQIRAHSNHQQYPIMKQNQAFVVQEQPMYYTTQRPLQSADRYNQARDSNQIQSQPGQGYYYDGQRVIQNPKITVQQPNNPQQSFPNNPQQPFPNNGYYFVSPNIPSSIPNIHINQIPEQQSYIGPSYGSQPSLNISHQNSSASGTQIPPLNLSQVPLHLQNNPNNSPHSSLLPSPQFFRPQSLAMHPSNSNQSNSNNNSETESFRPAYSYSEPIFNSNHQFSQGYMTHPIKEDYLYQASDYQGDNLQNYGIPQERINPQHSLVQPSNSQGSVYIEREATIPINQTYNMTPSNYGSVVQPNAQKQQQNLKFQNDSNRIPAQNVEQTISKNVASNQAQNSQAQYQVQNKTRVKNRETESGRKREEIEEDSVHFLSRNSTPLRSNTNVPVPIEKQANPNDLEKYDKGNKTPDLASPIKTKGTVKIPRKASNQTFLKQTSDPRLSPPHEQLHIRENYHILQHQPTNSELTQLSSVSQNPSRELSSEDRKITKSPNQGSKSVSFDEESLGRKEQLNSSIQHSKRSSKRNDGNEMSPIRVPRFTTETLTHNTSMERTSPGNASFGTPSSQRNRELSFHVSFGKTLRVDSEPKDRFDFIPSDVVSIDQECLTKKHVAPKQHTFDIISGQPKTSKTGTDIFPS